MSNGKFEIMLNWEIYSEVVHNEYKIKKKLAKILMPKFASGVAIIYILWYN